MVADAGNIAHRVIWSRQQNRQRNGQNLEGNTLTYDANGNVTTDEAGQVLVYARRGNRAGPAQGANPPDLSEEAAQLVLKQADLSTVNGEW